MTSQSQHNGKSCEFCEVESKRMIAKDELAFAIYDKFPVTPLHILIIPKRHVSSFFDLDDSEIGSILKLLTQMRTTILAEDSAVEGFNIGVNVGEMAGQTIFHCHIHLIPRRHGDVENPRGGVRGVIPRKQSY